MNGWRTKKYGSWYTPDFLIRRGLSWKHNVPVNETFSHTGTVWYDEEENKPMYWHQTYPIFKRERWKTRQYSIAVEISDPTAVSIARTVCKDLNDRKSGYGIGQLIAFVFTLWFSWFNNPITVGKVCSEAVAVSYPSMITTNKDNTDPEQAFRQLAPHATNIFHVIPKD